MNTYNINHTDPTKSPIEVEETGINEDFSIKFPGRIRLEWGKDVNENLLRMMEHFASPASGSNENSPDRAYSDEILQNPVDGQLWYNTSNERIYKYSDAQQEWFPLANRKQIYAANWGQVLHGQQLPKPVAPDGYVFPYEECIWAVSPHNYLDGLTSMICYSNGFTSEVVMQYVSKSQDIVVDGIANYLIIGILGNNNLGNTSPPIPLPPQNPTPPTPVDALILYDFSENQTTLPVEARAQLREQTETVFGTTTNYITDISTIQSFEALVTSTNDELISSSSAVVSSRINKNPGYVLSEVGGAYIALSGGTRFEREGWTFLTWTGLPLDDFTKLYINNVFYLKKTDTLPFGTLAVSIGQDLNTTDGNSTQGWWTPSANHELRPNWPNSSPFFVEQPIGLGSSNAATLVFDIPPSIERVNNNVTITFDYITTDNFQLFIQGDVYLGN